MGIAEWLAGVLGQASGMVIVFLAAMGVVVGLMLAVPRHAFRSFRKPLEDRDRYIGVRRHGRRWAARRGDSEGRHRTVEGGQSTWQYVDSGAWAIVDRASARVPGPLAGQDTTVLSGRRLTPSDTEEGHREQRSGSLGARTA
jgi:hypothetical protein